MSDFIVAVGLVLVIEGLLYAVAPDAMKRMMEQVMTIPATTLRGAGLVAMAVGVVIVYLVRI